MKNFELIDSELARPDFGANCELTLQQPRTQTEAAGARKILDLRLLI